MVFLRFQQHVAQFLERIERESARLGLAVEGEMTFRHDEKVFGRIGKWSHSQQVSMMERESEVSTQALVELGLLLELGEMIPQDLPLDRELYASADKATWMALFIWQCCMQMGWVYL